MIRILILSMAFGICSSFADTKNSPITIFDFSSPPLRDFPEETRDGLFRAVATRCRYLGDGNLKDVQRMVVFVSDPTLLPYEDFESVRMSVPSGSKVSSGDRLTGVLTTAGFFYASVPVGMTGRFFGWQSNLSISMPDRSTQCIGILERD